MCRGRRQKGEKTRREGGENGDGEVREDNLEGSNKFRDIESLEEREETTTFSKALSPVVTPGEGWIV